MVAGQNDFTLHMIRRFERIVGRRVEVSGSPSGHVTAHEKARRCRCRAAGRSIAQRLLPDICRQTFSQSRHAFAHSTMISAVCLDDGATKSTTRAKPMTNVRGLSR